MRCWRRCRRTIEPEVRKVQVIIIVDEEDNSEAAWEGVGLVEMSLKWLLLEGCKQGSEELYGAGSEPGEAAVRVCKEGRKQGSEDPDGGGVGGFGYG